MSRYCDASPAPRAGYACATTFASVTKVLTEDPVQEIINSTSLPPQMRSDLPRGFYRLDFRLNEGDLLIQKVPSCGKILRQFLEWLCRVRTIRFFEVFFLTGEVISATQEMHYFRHRSRRS